jgi:C1A family cysteine protease
MFDLVPRNPKYGWIPDLPDQRDFPYIRLAVSIPQLPSKFDLRINCTPIEDQGELGSCTACALVGNLEYIKKEKAKKIFNFSKLFLYYNERAIRHTVKEDSGASIRDGIKSLVKYGDCLEAIWPYQINKFTIKPLKAAYVNAKEYQIVSYYRIHTMDEMKHTISKGYPFVFGFAVYESFEEDIVAETGIMPMPEMEERMIGGHAVMGVGYDDKKKTFMVRNSWGRKWGDKGYFYMPYKYISNKYLASDFWTIRDME